MVSVRKECDCLASMWIFVLSAWGVEALLVDLTPLDFSLELANVPTPLSCFYDRKNLARLVYEMWNFNQGTEYGERKNMKHFRMQNKWKLNDASHTPVTSTSSANHSSLSFSLLSMGHLQFQYCRQEKHRGPYFHHPRCGLVFYAEDKQAAKESNGRTRKYEV